MSSFRGFTLVELMVVIGFISIMTAITMVSMSGKRDEEALRSAGREVAAAIRVAQNNALSGLGKGVPENRSLCWSKIEKVGSQRYKSFVRYKNSNGDSCESGNSGDGETDFYTLKNGVSFSSSGQWNSSGNSISFKIPQGDLRESTSTIILTKGTKSVAVCVLSSGSIIEKSVGTSSCP